MGTADMLKNPASDLAESVGKLDIQAGPTDANRHNDSDFDSAEDVAVQAASAGSKKKKKKKKPKRKPKQPASELGCIPDEISQPLTVESPEQEARWTKDLAKHALFFTVPALGLLADHYRSNLEILHTPSCRKVELITPRLKLRQVELGDITGIRRIKMEPTVQRTQLYGSPSISHIKEVFQNRYIRSSMPSINPPGRARCRDEYVFAITALDPASLVVGPPGQIGMRNRIDNAEGYLGNIAISLNPLDSGKSLLPERGKIATHPTFAQCDKVQLSGRLFYEIHPQLWGQGIMSEAFREVLRFAFEEIGCSVVISDPTDINTASIKLCKRQGMRYTKTTTDNSYNKPQVWHEITRAEWSALNRPGKEIKDHWGGKEVCRWCLNFRLAPLAVKCGGCNWAKYCSKECQRADWQRMNGGHRPACDSSAQNT